MTSRHLIAAAASIAALLAPAAQASMEWSLSTSNGGSSDIFTSQRIYSSGGVELVATAWSNTLGNDSSVTGDQQSIESAYLGWWNGNGLGVKNRDADTGEDLNEGASPEHATDNNQRYDSILLSFSEAVNLESLKLGWVYERGDSDVSVLAYTGSASTAPLAGLKYQSLTSNGWDLIGHYANVGKDFAKPINSGDVVSSFWLIGAFNPLVSAASAWNLGPGNDFVKLASISGSVAPPPPPGNSVPEPGSLVLAALGVVGLIGWRRRPA